MSCQIRFEILYDFKLHYNRKKLGQNEKSGWKKFPQSRPESVYICCVCIIQTKVCGYVYDECVTINTESWNKCVESAQNFDC